MIFFKILFFIYLITVFLFLIGWFKNNSQIDKTDYKVSIVIAVRNEEKNITQKTKERINVMKGSEKPPLNLLYPFNIKF